MNVKFIELGEVKLNFPERKWNDSQMTPCFFRPPVCMHAKANFFPLWWAISTLILHNLWTCGAGKHPIKVFLYFWMFKITVKDLYLLFKAWMQRWENVSLLRCTDLLLHFGEFSYNFFRNKSQCCTMGPWFHTQCWLLMLDASAQMCIIKMNLSDMLTLFHLYTLLQNHFLF